MLNRALVVTVLAFVWTVFMSFAVDVMRTAQFFLLGEGFLVFLRDIGFVVFWAALVSLPVAWASGWLRRNAERHQQASAQRIFPHNEVGDSADGWHVSGGQPPPQRQIAQPMMYNSAPPQPPVQRRTISELGRARLRGR
jgi:hypothetical protein